MCLWSNIADPRLLIVEEKLGCGVHRAFETLQEKLQFELERDAYSAADATYGPYELQNRPDTFLNMMESHKKIWTLHAYSQNQDSRVQVFAQSRNSTKK